MDDSATAGPTLWYTRRNARTCSDRPVAFVAKTACRVDTDRKSLNRSTSAGETNVCSSSPARGLVIHSGHPTGAQTSIASCYNKSYKMPKYPPAAVASIKREWECVAQTQRRQRLLRRQLDAECLGLLSEGRTMLREEERQLLAKKHLALGTSELLSRLTNIPEEVQRQVTAIRSSRATFLKMISVTPYTELFSGHIP